MAKLRMGMVGGGADGFIGAVHRQAAALDGDIELVCGVFSRDAETSLAFAQSLHITADRCYGDFAAMLISEAKLPPEQRMQFVSIVTPNHLHFPMAKAALEAGFHVFSDKPATLSLAEAISLKKIISETGMFYGLAHVYAAYPLMQEARLRIAEGGLGQLRKLVVEYSQGWLSSADEHSDAWRLNPDLAGVSCCMGDIGVHAAHLAEYLSGKKILEICAELNSVVPGRVLDDDGTALLRFEDDLQGVLLASQISLGDENGLRIRIYGDKGALEWSQQEPNSLLLKSHNNPLQVLRTGETYLSPVTQANTRLPPGHPEGFIEAFANLYKAFSRQVDLGQSDLGDSRDEFSCPGIGAALRGMAFIETVVEASQSEQKWHSMPNV